MKTQPNCRAFSTLFEMLSADIRMPHSLLKHIGLLLYCNLFIQLEPINRKVFISASVFPPLLSPVHCFHFPGGNHVLVLFNPYFHAKSMCWRFNRFLRSVGLSLDPAMRSMLSANLRDFSHPPTAIVSTKSSLRHRLDLLQDKFEKANRASKRQYL